MANVGSVYWQQRRIRSAAAEDEPEDEAADVAKVLCAARVGAGGEQATNRLVVAVQDLAVAVHPEPAEGDRDAGLDLQGAERAGPQRAGSFRQRRVQSDGLTRGRSLVVRQGRLEGRLVDAPTGDHL